MAAFCFILAALLQLNDWPAESAFYWLEMNYESLINHRKKHLLGNRYILTEMNILTCKYQKSLDGRMADW